MGLRVREGQRSVERAHDGRFQGTVGWYDKDRVQDSHQNACCISGMVKEEEAELSHAFTRYGVTLEPRLKARTRPDANHARTATAAVGLEARTKE